MPELTEKPGFNFPGPVSKEALEYFRAKGWTIGFDYRDVWRSEHAMVFTVAKAMQLDILRDIRNAVDKAQAKGETFEQFRKQLEPLLQQKGWWGIQEQTDPLTGERREVQLGSPRRLKTIYNANLRTARAAGQWERAGRTKQLRPYFLYQLGPSKEHRLQHTQWQGLILSVDDAFWNNHYPPNGWGCKCHLRQLSAREAERRGGITPTPEIKMREWINKRTGEVEQVPKGIDPGWNVNPGKDRDKQLERLLIDKIQAAHSADQKAAKDAWND